MSLRRFFALLAAFALSAAATAARAQQDIVTLEADRWVRLDFEAVNECGKLRRSSVVIFSADDESEARFRLRTREVDGTEYVLPELLDGFAYCRLHPAEEGDDNGETKLERRLYYPILWTRSISAGTAGTDFIVEASAKEYAYVFLETAGSEVVFEIGGQEKDPLGDMAKRAVFETSADQNGKWTAQQKVDANAPHDHASRKRAREFAEKAGL